jgi:hypothetical protein
VRDVTAAGLAHEGGEGEPPRFTHVPSATESRMKTLAKRRIVVVNIDGISPAVLVRQK